MTMVWGGMFRRRVASVAAVAAAGGMLVLAPPGHAATSAPSALAASSTASAGAASSQPLAGSPAATPRDITLITGDRVHVTRSGARTTATVVHAASSGPAAVVTTMRLGDRSFVVPAVARPYLGRFLDPSLFDVSDAAGGSTVRVDIAYTGSARPSVPGVTITSAAAGHASGYLTATSAAAFGAALTKQAIADSAANWPARSTLFGSVTRISAPGSPSDARPSYPMKTLTIRATDHRGAALNYAFGFVLNADDGRRFMGYFELDRGVAKVSLPTGHYLVVGSEDRYSATAFSSWALVAADYRVTGSGQTLQLDARKATAAPRATTAEPAAVQGLMVDLLGADAKGFAGFDYGFDATPGLSRLFLPPTPAPKHGSLVEQVTLNAQDTSRPGGRYRFDGGWSSPGIPAGQTHRTPPVARMARIDTTYYADEPHRDGGTARAVFLPGSFFVFTNIYPARMPMTRAEYAFGPPGTFYQASALGNIDSPYDPDWFDQDPQYLAPGSRTATTWLRDPIIQAAADPAPGAAFPTTYACRTATSLTLALFLLDNVPSHIGEVWGSPSGDPVAEFTLTRNGTTLVDDLDAWGAMVDVPAGSATYRAVSTIDRTPALPNLSMTTQTDVTFVSGATTGRATPASWWCPSDEGKGSTLLPVLRALVDLGGTTHGTVPVGRTPFDLQIGYPQGAGTASITSVSVEVSRDGLGTWTPVPVTSAGAGHWTAAFTATSADRGHTMDLRINATDAAGGILHQTTTRAFTIGS